MVRKLLIVLGVAGFLLVPLLTLWLIYGEPLLQERAAANHLRARADVMFTMRGHSILNPIIAVTIRGNGPSFTDDDFRRLARLTQLEVLHLENVSFDPASLSRLENNRGIRFFRCIGTDLDDAALLDFCRTHPRLTGLTLGRNPKLTEQGLIDALDAAPHLDGLRLYGGPVLTEAGFAALERHPTLKSLALDEFHATELPWAALATCLRLETFSLHNCTTFDDDGLAAIGVLPGLTKLTLYDTGVTSEGLEAFKAAHPHVVIEGKEVLKVVYPHVVTEGWLGNF